jgi:Transcriptional regulatory protein, C terminal
LNHILVAAETEYMTNLVKENKGFQEITHCRLNPFDIYKHFHEEISTIVIGIESPTHQDWKNLEFVTSINPQIPKYMMIDRDIQPEDIHISKKLQFKKITNNAFHLEQLLLNPFMKSNKSLHKFKQPGSEEDMIMLGFNTYLHYREKWIKDSASKRNLSNREFELLSLFIEHEGEIITKSTIISIIWKNAADEGCVSVLISRLRKKLGKAASIIKGRKQGGYIFKREKNVISM